MKKSTTSAAVVPAAIIEDAWQEVGASFERFCLTTGLATLASMLEEDATQVCGARYDRADGRDGHRWGKTTGKVGFHGGVPIRLSPIPTTSRVLPIPRVKLGLGRAAISPAMSSAS